MMVQLGVDSYCIASDLSHEHKEALELFSACQVLSFSCGCLQIEHFSFLVGCGLNIE